MAPPQAYWQESQGDFAPALRDVLARVFPNPGDLIDCATCYSSRVYVAPNGRTIIQNGELSLADLARLKNQPGYAQAKSILISRETPAGIELRLLALEDGRILYTGMADSTLTLDRAQPPLRLARELERRQRGESLSYVNIDLGLLPSALVQVKFLEQWGNHNQHLSGLALSFFNPNGALGAAYMYMLPFQRKATVGVIAYYSLKNMFDASTSGSFASSITGQLAINYAFSGSYGMFLSGDTSGVISVGFSLLNPILFPFLL